MTENSEVRQLADRAKKILEHVPLAAAYEQLAEECTELAKASLKMARKLRDENPTPLTMKQIDDEVDEEVSDVMLCLMTLDRYAYEHRVAAKLDRWEARTRSRQDDISSKNPSIRQCFDTATDTQTSKLM